MIDDMRIRNFSPSTIEGYVRRVRFFAEHFSQSPDELGLEDIREYQVFLINKGISSSLFNITVCALRFLYLKVLKRDWAIESIPYTRKPKLLPVILSVGEVARLLPSIRTPRHRTIAATMYGAGLRVSEAISLRVRDIDSERMTIRVNQGKGKKDRFTLLPISLLDRLRAYWVACQPQGPWLFPATTTGSIYVPHRFNGRSRRREIVSEWTRESAATRCVIVLQPTCWSAALMCGRFKCCSATVA